MKTFTILFLFIFINGWTNAQELLLKKLYADKSQSSITYSMNHLLHSWEGVCKDVNSVILSDEKRDEIKQVAVTVKISSFDSQNANRDSHMMEATDAIKFPNINFASTSILREGNVLHVTGTLTFHGIGKTILIDAAVKKVNDKAEITGDFDVNMKDFNIEPPSLMGVSTSEIIKLKFTMIF